MRNNRAQVLAFSVLALSALSSCYEADGLGFSDKSAEDVNIDGYGGLNFGDEYEDIVGRYGLNNFNPASIARCMKELPLKGCYLAPAREKIFEIIEGIPFALSAKFNTLGKMTDVGLEYDVRDKATFEQCLDVYARALDWVIVNHGMVVQRPLSAGENSADFQSRATPAGNSLEFYSKDGDFIALPGRTLTATLRTENLPSDMNDWANEEHIRLDSFFVSQHCSVTITYSDIAS